MGTLIHTKDERLFRCITQEVNKLAGMFCRYFVLSTESSNINPLYNEMGEPVYNVNFSGDEKTLGVRLACFTQAPDHNVSAREEGKDFVWDAQLWIAKNDWVSVMGKNAYPPKIGDIIKAWDKFYDVTDVNRDGYLDDERSVFTQWRVDLRKNDKYSAERRVNDG